MGTAASTSPARYSASAVSMSVIEPRMTREKTDRAPADALLAAAVQHDRLAGGLGVGRGVALVAAVATHVARLVFLGAARPGIADLAGVDAVDAIVAALALPRQVVGDVGADVAGTVAAVGGAQHADRHASAVGAVLVRRALLLFLLRADLDAAAASRQGDGYLRCCRRRARDQHQDRKQRTYH